MPILPRYFLRQFLPIFFLCLLLFAGVLLMNHFLKLFNLALMRGISPLWIAGCFARLMPFILSLALPMAYLVAVMLSLGQLAERGEIMALRASGFSFAEMTWPLLAVGALLSGLLLYLNHKASPEGFHSFRKQQALAAQKIMRLDLEPSSMIELGPWKLSAAEVKKDTGELAGVYLLRQKTGDKNPQGPGNDQRSLRITAARGRLSLDKGRQIQLELEDGQIQIPNPDPLKFSAGTFRRYRVSIPLVPTGPLQRNPDIQELTTAQLRGRIASPQTEPQHRVEYRVEAAVRSAAALSTFIFFWIGAPLGVQMGRHSRSLGFVISLLVLFGFYALIALGIGVGRRYEPLSDIAPWAPDAAGMIAGLWLTARAAFR
ncbi:MAG: LptF/LptG family permease [Elusimicrobia bacterium]|nr:LptF/LptG family permease [Elusimicrobiota bacterium]